MRGQTWRRMPETIPEGSEALGAETFFHSQMALGLYISLACLTLYFIFPSMYYANLPRTLLIIVGTLGCLMVIRFSPFVGLAWAAFLLLFIYYGLNSRWYQKMVFDRTYKEWKRYLGDAEGTAEKTAAEESLEETLLKRVAESWNPKWSAAEIERLVAGCRDTDELVERVQKFRPPAHRKPSQHAPREDRGA